MCPASSVSQWATHVDHGYLLGAGARVIGSVGQVAVEVIHAHVLSQVIVHLLLLFPGGQTTVRRRHFTRHKAGMAFHSTTCPQYASQLVHFILYQTQGKKHQNTKKRKANISGRLQCPL